ncbi:MAG: hypothetical protein LBM01_00955 [Christensenellaceae bacterium]|jgi:hypothetical protein|nr:hypothetical protein [Christensenellaceae bacterium]
MYEPVKNDLFDIASRLQTIDKFYLIFNNRKLNRFEVHTNKNPSNASLAFVVPFGGLDNRTLDYAKSTRRERADEIEQEILIANQGVSREKEKTTRELGQNLTEMLSFAMRNGLDTKFNIKEEKKWF